MKIFTDLGNLESLKLLLTCKLNDIDVEIISKHSRDHSGSLLCQPRYPVLENDSGSFLFSANAAARWLCCLRDEERFPMQCDEWLEWESFVLQPTIQSICSRYSVSGQIPQELLDCLHKLLSKLDSTICNNKIALIGDNISVVDVVIYCSILPCYCEGTPFKGIVSPYQHILQWFMSISDCTKLKPAFAQLPGGCKWSNLKFPSVPHSSDSMTKKSVRSSSIADTDKLKTSENSESVTAKEMEVAETIWKAGRKSLPTLKPRQHPILPQEAEKNVLITSALPYVNNVPHLGNIIGCVLSADTFARYCRLRDLNTLYICGTDEYGTATETKAVEEGLTPQEICDKYHQLHREIYEWFNISFDYFGRTTTQQQTDIAQDIFWKLYKNDQILKDSVEQLLCEKCDRFLADRFVEGTCPFCTYEDARGDQCDKCGKLINAVELTNARCKVCRNTPISKTSQHLFMDLPKLQPLLEKYLEKSFEDGLWSSNTKVITKSWIRDGLKPRCISRDLKWGTPVPLDGFKDKVFYVWYDAPIGYISITANYTKDWKRWWQNPQQVELYNFMAKDNVPFHSVIFPSSLLGTGDNWTLVNNLSATEYLNYEDGKFSKSRGVGVFGNDAKDTGIPADVWRFYLLFIRPESQDTTFNWEDFVLKNNSELLNNLGNFINRALMFLNNNFKGVVPEITLMEEDKILLAAITNELQAYNGNVSHIKLREGLRNILSISRLGNQYLQASKPWVGVKGADQEKQRAASVIALAANVCCLLSIMLKPYMPKTSDMIKTQLNAPSHCNILHDVFVPYLDPGHKIGKPAPLFQKIEQSLVDAMKKRFEGKGTSVTKQGSDSGRQKKPENAKNPENDLELVENLTKAVSEQGEKVRHLKSQKSDGSIIKLEVEKLLELKQQLAVAKGMDPEVLKRDSKKKSKKKN